MEIEETKYMDVKEFRENGYLQELNRTFLHPLGLAIEVKINEDGTEELGRIWDYRKDKEELHYALPRTQTSSSKRSKEFIKKSKYIEKEKRKRYINRRKTLGFWIEPLEPK